MPAIRPGQTIRQDDPILKFTGRLEPGRHRFQLVVVDDSGNVSGPADLFVVVKPKEAQPITRPGRIATPRRPTGRVTTPGTRRRPQ